MDSAYSFGVHHRQLPRGHVQTHSVHRATQGTGALLSTCLKEGNKIFAHRRNAIYINMKILVAHFVETSVFVRKDWCKGSVASFGATSRLLESFMGFVDVWVMTSVVVVVVVVENTPVSGNIVVSCGKVSLEDEMK